MADQPFAPLAPLTPLMDACVHCGFCLPACPSYVVLGRETDSPRGRIYAMRAGLEGRLPMNARVVEHFDTCLGCLACETACPSGVRYEPLLEVTRASVEQSGPRTRGDRWLRRLLLTLLPRPASLRWLALPLVVVGPLTRAPWLQALLPARVRPLLRRAPDVRLATLLSEVPAVTPATGDRRQVVGLIIGCVQRAFFGPVNQATARVLAAEGHEVRAPRRQGCCGALALHAGATADARAAARHLIETFEQEPVDTIVVNAAGCGATLKRYGHLLADDPAWASRAAAFAARVRDASELLTAHAPRATRHPLPLRVAYHDACHLSHGQGVRQPPRDLIAAIPGVTALAVAEGDLCCGSAGTFNLTQPEVADALGRRKAAHLAAVHPDVVVTANPGCLMQIQQMSAAAGHPLRVVHLMTLLDASLRGTPLS